MTDTAALLTDEERHYRSCANCQRGDHTLCMVPRCACTKGQHRNRPDGPPLRRPEGAGEHGKPPARNTARSRGTAKGKVPDPAPTPPPKPARDTARPQAVIEVVWEEPPAPKPRGIPPIEVRVIPAMEKIEQHPGRWARLATSHAASWGKANAKRLQRHYADQGWTFVGGRLEDAPGSAIWGKLDVPTRELPDD